jgi:hypothetical protein
VTFEPPKLSTGRVVHFVPPSVVEMKAVYSTLAIPFSSPVTNARHCDADAQLSPSLGSSEGVLAATDSGVQVAARSDVRKRTGAPLASVPNATQTFGVGQERSASRIADALGLVADDAAAPGASEEHKTSTRAATPRTPHERARRIVAQLPAAGSDV